MLLFYCFYSHSALLEVVEPLDFGSVVVTGNSSISTTRLFRSGQQQSTNRLLVLTPGHPAIVRLSDFPPNRTFTISANLPVMSAAPFAGTAQFSITGLEIPNSIATNSFGVVEFTLGATLATSGNGLPYYNQARYTMDIELEITY